MRIGVAPAANPVDAGRMSELQNQPQKLKRLNREPILSPGGLSRLAVVLITLTVGGMLSKGVHRILHPKKPLAPPEIRELAAECVLTGEPKACAIAWSWRPHE